MYKNIEYYLEKSLASSNNATTPLPLESAPLASLYRGMHDYKTTTLNGLTPNG